MASSHPTDSDDSDDAHGALVADVFARGCSSRHVLEDIVGKWGVLALVALHEGPYRFNALRRRVDGVSEKMLAQTLHALNRHGLVDRHVHSTIPPRVEYSLTPVGDKIASKLLDLITLVEDSLPQILAAQRDVDGEQAPAPTAPA